MRMQRRRGQMKPCGLTGGTHGKWGQCAGGAGSEESGNLLVLRLHVPHCAGLHDSCRIHAKCLRSTQEVRDYFRDYRDRKKNVSGLETGCGFVLNIDLGLHACKHTQLTQEPACFTCTCRVASSHPLGATAA